MLGVFTVSGAKEDTPAARKDHWDRWYNDFKETSNSLGSPNSFIIAQRTLLRSLRESSMWVVLHMRVRFRVVFIRVPYYRGDLKRGP